MTTTTTIYCINCDTESFTERNGKPYCFTCSEAYDAGESDAMAVPTLTTQPPHTPTPSPTWYEASTGNHQGLIVEEQTGRNIAVTYDKADAPVIVRAVNNHDKLVEALKIAMEAFDGLFQAIDNGTDASTEILEDDSLWPIAQLRGVLAELGE